MKQPPEIAIGADIIFISENKITRGSYIGWGLAIHHGQVRPNRWIISDTISAQRLICGSTRCRAIVKMFHSLRLQSHGAGHPDWPSIIHRRYRQHLDKKAIVYPIPA